MSEETGARNQPAEPQFDESQVQHAFAQIRGEQNLSLGAVAGAAAALVGAALWAVITVTTGYQIGFMAIGIGFLVGLAVRTAGKGVVNTFGFMGAGFALLGCLLGNLLAVCGMVSQQNDIPFMEVLAQLDFQAISEMMTATFSPMDLLFYGIAVYEGYHLSFRQVTEDDIKQRITGVPPAPLG